MVHRCTGAHASIVQLQGHVMSLVITAAQALATSGHCTASYILHRQTPNTSWEARVAYATKMTPLWTTLSDGQAGKAG